MTPTQTFWRDRPAVYRVFDETGRLIYVGQSIKVPHRLAEHRSQSWWYRLLAAKVRVELHPTQDAAKAAEKIAIQEERPVFNAMGYGDWRDRPYWSTDDHELYATWRREMFAEQQRHPRYPRRGMSARMADGARRRLSVGLA